MLACPRCEGRMKFIAVIKDREVIVRILAHVALVRSASLDCAREALGRHELTGELADG